MCSNIVRIMEHGLALINLPVFELFHHCADFFSGFSIPYQLRILLVCYTEKQNKSKPDPGQATKGLAIRYIICYLHSLLLSLPRNLHQQNNRMKQCDVYEVLIRKPCSGDVKHGQALLCVRTERMLQEQYANW